jgi:hypothetical protein
VIRILIVSIVFAVVYLGYLSLRQQEFSKAERKKALIVSLSGIALVSLLLGLHEYNQRAELSEQLANAQFSVEDNNRFTNQIDGVGVKITYYSGYSSELTAPRLFIQLEFDQEFQNLAALFCNDREYEDYKQGKYQNWYPTPEIKLTNGHFVGRCFPKTIVENVKALGQRTNDFSPANTRYLFLPAIDSGDKHLVHLYTENINGESLTSRLMDFIHYYQIISTN